MTLAQGQLLVSILGIALATSAAVIAWRTFLRSERWKQAEFLAGVMKELAQDERTQRALSMIDWGLRSIKLGESTDPDGGYVKVSRQMQTLALRPHCLLGQGLTAPESIRFTPEEAAIRDCYDSLLDRLERLSNYVKTKLITIDNLKPYIVYWIDDICCRSDNSADAAWRASLMTYIDYYRFHGVQHLFKRFGRPIDPASEAYRAALAQMEDRALAAQFEGCVRKSTIT